MLLRSKFTYIYLVVTVFIVNRNLIICKEKKTFLNFERPRILFLNESIAKDARFTARRYNRSNPLHFVSAEFELLQPVDNSFVFNIYIYQLVTRLYKQSFIDYHIGSCDLLLVDNFLQKSLTEAYYRNPVSERPMKTLGCPIKPGKYKFKDMKTALINLPLSIPFLEGRLYMNLTHENRLILSECIDFALKQI